MGDVSSLIVLRNWIENNPAVCTGFLAAITALAALVEFRSRYTRRRSLRRLAAQWQMTYSPKDRLRVAIHVAEELPSPGAADLSVYDVIWGRQGEMYRYIFTLEYTTGVLSGRRRRRQVGALVESRKDDTSHAALQIAPAQGTLVEQYQSLHH